jgi:hypothetical protein
LNYLMFVVCWFERHGYNEAEIAGQT